MSIYRFLQAKASYFVKNIIYKLKWSSCQIQCYPDCVPFCESVWFARLIYELFTLWIAKSGTENSQKGVSFPRFDLLGYVSNVSFIRCKKNNHTLWPVTKRKINNPTVYHATLFSFSKHIDWLYCLLFFKRNYFMWYFNVCCRGLSFVDSCWLDMLESTFPAICW